jgi:hypothetical protein
MLSLTFVIRARTPLSSLDDLRAVFLSYPSCGVRFVADPHNHIRKDAHLFLLQGVWMDSVWGAFIRVSLLISSFARRSDSPSRFRTSSARRIRTLLGCLRLPNVRSHVPYEPDSLIRSPAGEALWLTRLRRAPSDVQRNRAQ